MSKIAIYLKGRRLDLFDDETINITSKATDINNISKVFTDLTKDFTVPATPNNNSVFAHFYDVDNDSTFNPNVRIDAYIEFDTIPYKFGKIQLEKIKLKNKVPHSYTITFYGNLLQLDEKFGNDTLNDLDLSFYDHLYDSDNVRVGLTSLGLKNGDIIYPLISQRLWQYNNTDTEPSIANQSRGILFNELKPAIRLKRVVEAIESKYDIEFDSSFFDRAPFTNLFMWLSKGKDKIVAEDVEPVRAIFNTPNTLNVANASLENGTDIKVSINRSPFLPISGLYISEGIVKYSFVPINTTSTYTLKVFRKEENGDFTLHQTQLNVSGVTTGEVYIRRRSGNNTEDTFDTTFFFSVEASNEPVNGDLTVTVLNKRIKPSGESLLTSGTAISNLTASPFFIISQQIPNMKVKDFLGGIIKLFNMVISPKNEKTFLIEPMDVYKRTGKIYDITRYVDITESTIDRPKIFNQIVFKHQKQETILAKKYREMTDSTGEIGYGDIRANYNIEEKRELKVESPFEVLMFEKMSDIRNENAPTPIHAGYAIGDNLESVSIKPMLFYYNGYVNIEDYPIYLDNEAVYNYNMVSNYDSKEISQERTSILWGDSINSWTYTNSTNSLYYSFWREYISDVYNRKQRTYYITTYLPTSLVLNLKINDKLVINDLRYNIQDFTTDLVTGKSSLTLSLDFPTFIYENTIDFEYYNASVNKEYTYFIVTSKDSFTASSDSAWVQVNDIKNGVISVTIGEKPNSDTRSATITVDFGSEVKYINIIQ